MLGWTVLKSHKKVMAVAPLDHHHHRCCHNLNDAILLVYQSLFFDADSSIFIFQCVSTKGYNHILMKAVRRMLTSELFVLLILWFVACWLLELFFTYQTF